MEEVRVRYKDATGKLWSLCSLECFFWLLRRMLKESQEVIEQARETLKG
jgi:hypothetical protein